MVSESSPPRFVFRSRGSPSCASECVKIQFHVQREEPETAIIDGGFSCGLGICQDDDGSLKKTRFLKETMGP
jgi:hypothetical protein